MFQPSSKKPSNPFADAPKKLDEVFGDIRKSEPVPEVMPLDVDRNVAVYFETGDYSVSGLGEDVKLKPKQLTARQGTNRNRIQRNSHWNITVYKISVFSIIIVHRAFHRVKNLPRSIESTPRSSNERGSRPKSGKRRARSPPFRCPENQPSSPSQRKNQFRRKMHNLFHLKVTCKCN